jgi:hypothetical protein
VLCVIIGNSFFVSKIQPMPKRLRPLARSDLAYVHLVETVRAAVPNIHLPTFIGKNPLHQLHLLPQRIRR